MAIVYPLDKKAARIREKLRLKWIKEYRKQNPEAKAANKAAKADYKARQKGGKNSINSQYLRDRYSRGLERNAKLRALTPEQRTRLKAAETLERNTYQTKFDSMRKSLSALNPWDDDTWKEGEYDKGIADKYMAEQKAFIAHGGSRKSAIWNGSDFNEAGQSIVDAPKGAPAKGALARSAARNISTPKTVPNVSKRMKQKAANRGAGIRT